MATSQAGIDFRHILWARWRGLCCEQFRTSTNHATVRVYDDQEPEPDETFTLTLTNPTGAIAGRRDGDRHDQWTTATPAATLTPSDIEDTTATLTIGGHADGWWYRGRSSGGVRRRGEHCTAVAAGTTAVSISGLTAVTDL